MRIYLLSFVALTVALNGCATSPEARVEPRAIVAPNAGPVLRIEGESILLGDAATTPLSLQVFVARIQQLASASRHEDVGQIVRTYPDLAEQAVLSPEVAPRAQRTIAAWLDVLAAPAQGGWSLLVADRADNPNRYATYKRNRAAAWSALRRGAFADVADRTLDPPADGPTPWPALDAMLLQATAALAAGRPTDAATLFEQAADRAVLWDSRVAARASLFASLGFQLAGEADSASRTRAAAVRIVSLSDVHDPMTLRLLLKTHSPKQTLADALSMREVRARLGRVELQRGSPQAALLAWRAAETEPGNEPTLNRLRLGQAESLIALRQDEPAIAMLIGLAPTDMRPEALVMLGLVQMRRGQVENGLAMLNEAVAGTSAESHPHVYADSGLALLSTGNSTTGLALVREARDVYHARDDKQALRKLLTNELRYAQAIDNPDLVERVRQSLLEIDH